MRAGAFVAGLLGVVVALLVGGVPSFGAEKSVTLSGTSFSPKDVTITVGDTVKWTNQSGTHNVHFEGEPTGQPAAAADASSPAWANGVTRTFNETGTFNYYCDPHQGFGMTGRVIVQPAGATGTGTGATTGSTTGSTTDTTTTTTGTTNTGTTTTGTTTTGTTTTGTTTTGTTTTQGGGSETNTTTTPGGDPGGGSETTTTTEKTFDPDGTEQPRLLRAGAVSNRFCVARSRRCRKPGVRIGVRLSAPARLVGRLERRAPRRGASFRKFGRVDLGRVAAGRRVVSFTRTGAGRLLLPGRYRLTLRVGDSTRTIKFAVG